MDELVRVVVEVRSEDVDLVSGLAWSLTGRSGPGAPVGPAVAGIEEQPDPGVGGAVRLLVALPAGAVADMVDLLADRWPVTVAGAVTSEPWLDAWQAWARPVRVGRVVLRPAWLDPSPDGVPPDGADDVVLRLDPGRSFGSGAHPTTQLVLAELQRGSVAGAQVLDVGCGSGVLAVAAARLGAARATGVDVEPSARDATRANAAANGVAHLVEVADGGLDDVTGSYHVVVANIGAAVLVDLAPAIVERLAPGGRLVLSGVLVEQVPDVLAAYRAVTATVAAADGGWVAISGRAPERRGGGG